MERNGDVATEFNSCHSENFCLNTSLFKTGCDKMCKDDNSESLFCKMRSDNVMTSGFEDEHEVSISAFKNQCLEKLNRSESDFVNNEEHILSIIHQKSEGAINNCLLPIWEKTAKLCDNSLTSKLPENFLLSDDSFVNGAKVMNDKTNSFQISSSCINPNATHNSDSSLGATSDSLQLTCVEELSSSSIEEISVSSPVAGNLNKRKRKLIACSESENLFDNAGVGKNSSIAKEQSPPHNLSSLSFTIPKLEMAKEIETSPKSEMPELIPTICLDDDDDEESIPYMEKKSCEKTNIADSPEMPKLVPFSTDLEDIMKIKKERLDNDETPNNSNFQLVTTAKRKLFSQHETDSLNSIKKNKIDIELKNCISKNSSPEIFTLDDSISYQSEALDFENEASLNKESQNFVNPDFQEFFSEMNRNLKLLSESNKRSEDNEPQCSLKPSQSQIHLRKLSLDSSLPHCADKPIFHESLAVEGGENESKFSFKHCLPSNDSDDNDSLASKPECQNNKNSSSEGPEIEEIEGVRFFQFRSKHAMEEFNKKPPEMEMSVEMIIPTKTTDITQIKGWRNKYFAPDSQLQVSCTKSENNIDECSQNAVSLPPLDEQVDNKCMDFCVQDNDIKSASTQEKKNFDDLKCLVTDTLSASEILTNTPIKADPDQKNNISCSEILTSSSIKPDADEKEKLYSVEIKKSKSVPDDPMSAFVSKKLDDFLLNSSTLNVNFLQKTNPNIKPISPDAPILSIGKLRKIDYNLNISSKHVPYKTKFFYKIRNDSDDKSVIIPSPKDSSAPVITLSSSEERSSSDDDIPVADLYRNTTETKCRLTRSQPKKCMKRRISDSSTDQASQRVVLRLTKQSKGTSEGYKVSDISVENPDPVESSLKVEDEETLPDDFKKPTDGSLLTIKDGIFLKESEPKLLEEFLNNLNMYGTSKDVAMLVQSNQSYFMKGPVLTVEHCNEALDALASNKEFLDLKNKATPKKKLKTWQKYLPKKLSTTQQRQFTYKAPQSKYHNTAVNSDSSEKLLNSKDKIKQNNNDEQLDSIKASREQNLELIKSKNLGNISNSKEETSKLDTKAKFLNNQKTVGLKKTLKSKHLIMQKKRARRRKLVIDNQLALLERGKRSIRMPARYLDSAVLAAGSEWVSPIFIEDEKKTRKQLLDVLDKITPNKDTSISAEKTNQIVPNHTRKKSIDLEKPQKRISKESITSKKQKGESTKKVLKGPKLIEKQNLSAGSQNFHENPSCNEILYPMPSCVCSPCSRTLSFQRIEKLFVCFSNHNRKLNSSVEKKNNHETKSIANEKNIKLSEDNPEITKTNVLDTDECKRLESEENVINPENKKINLLSSNDSLTSEIKSSDSKNTLSNTVDINTPILKTTTSNSSIINMNESCHTQSPAITKILYPNTQFQQINTTNNSLPPPNNSDNVTKEYNSQILNVTGVANKVLLLVPPYKSIPKNSTVPILPKTLPLQNIQKPISEGRSKPPILARKTVSENQINSTKNMLVSSQLSSLSKSSINQNSVVLQLPKVKENFDNSMSLVYGSSQMAPVIKGSSLNSAANNSAANTSQPKMPVFNAIRVGDKVYFCSSDTKGRQSWSTPTLLNVRTNEMPVKSVQVPFLQTALINDSLNSDPSEIENSNTTSTFQKTTSEIIENHNLKKQSSERRRKSPLSERKFDDSSDSEVDVDTVDQDFDAALSLKRHYADCDADVFDNDCTFTFLSDLSTILSPHKRKTINERNRRQLISNMSDKIRRTSKFFQSARSLSEILNRASFAVSHLSMQNQSRVIAKRILQVRNAQLLKRLSDNIQAIPDPKSRIFVKKKLIRATAHAWKRDRHSRKKISNPPQTAKSTYSSLIVDANSSPEQENSITTDASKVVLSGVDSKLERTPQKNDQNNCQVTVSLPKETITSVEFSENGETAEIASINNVAMTHVMETDITEQPHVQLRIVEASPIKEDVEINIQIKEKDTETKTLVSKEKISPSSICKAKRRLQFRVSSDANTSDEDHLVIDLSGDDTSPNDASLPKKDLTLPVSSSTPVERLPIKKFPGLIPLFATDFIKDHVTLGTSKPGLSLQTRSAENGANQESSICSENQNIVAKRTSKPGLMSLEPVEEKVPDLLGKQQNSLSLDDKSLERQNKAVTPANKVLDSSKKETLHRKNGQTPLSLVPQTLKSSKSSDRNGDIPRNSVDNGYSVRRPRRKLKAFVSRGIPEEIVIDDSDDDVIEIKDSLLSTTSKSSVKYPHCGLSTEEKQIHS